MSNAIAIIPARGGSKRIFKKNIKEFFGKPLIAYSIEAALNSKLFDKVIVSTDDAEIAKVAQKYGAEVPFMRPKELADDFSTTGDVVADVIERLRKQGESFHYICTIYATAPFLEEKYLIEGYEILRNSDAKMAFSVTSMPFPIQRTFKITPQNRCEMFTPEYFRSRSQDLEEAYQDAGQFYWEDTTQEWHDITFGSQSIPIVLPRYLVQDIDTPEDWRRAELMYASLYPDTFDQWNSLKKQLDCKEKIIDFYEGNIYFMSVGQNIGHEIYGKNELFLRPVLVYKKLTNTTFLGIPLTSQNKEGSYFFEFSYKKNKRSVALLHQMRVYDIRRSEYLSGKINKNTKKNLEAKLLKFMEVTSSKKKRNADEG